MPYIERKRRAERPVNVGDLTFRVQQVLNAYLSDRQQVAGIRYQDLATCEAALTGALRDFQERIVSPYEVKKRTDNGDVWSPNVLQAVGYE